jgi:hypothetical protein
VKDLIMPPKSLTDAFVRNVTLPKKEDKPNQVVGGDGWIFLILMEMFFLGVGSSKAAVATTGADFIAGLVMCAIGGAWFAYKLKSWNL